MGSRTTWPRADRPVADFLRAPACRRDAAVAIDDRHDEVGYTPRRITLPFRELADDRALRRGIGRASTVLARRHGIAKGDRLPSAFLVRASAVRCIDHDDRL